MRVRWVVVLLAVVSILAFVLGRWTAPASVVEAPVAVPAPPAEEPATRVIRFGGPEVSVINAEPFDLERLMEEVEGTHATSLTVTVVDADDQAPIEDVTVRLRSKDPAGEPLEGRTAGDGSVRFASVAYPRLYELTLSAPLSGVDLSDRIYVAKPDAAHVARITRTRQVRGRVLSVRGEPVAGAHVVVYGDSHHGQEVRSETRSTVANASGEFVVALGVEADAVRVTAIAPGHVPAWTDATRDGAVHWSAEVTLDDGPRLLGVIRNADGEGARGAVVCVFSVRAPGERDRFDRDVRPWRGGSGGFREPGLGPQGFREVVSRQLRPLDETGAFETFVFVPAERLWITASLRDHRPLIRELAAVTGPGRLELDLGVIDLERPVDPVTVRVVDEEDRPVCGVDLVFQSLALPQAFQLNSGKHTTDADGAVRSAFVERGTAYHVFVRGAANETLTNQHAPSNGDWVIRLSSREGD